MKEKILESLKGLDTKTDSYWNKDGQVNLNAFKFVHGEDVTREQLEDAAPGYNRESAGSYFGDNGDLKATDKGTAPTGGENTSKDEVKETNVEGVGENSAGEKVSLETGEPLYEIGKLKAEQAPGSEHLTEEALTNPELHQETLSETASVVNKTAVEDNSAEGLIKKLLGQGREVDLENMSEEDIQKLRDQIPERRNQLIETRELFAKAIENEFYALARIEEAAQKVEKAEPLADMVKRVHEANVNGGANYEIDRGRQRVAQPIPPLNKK